MSYITTLRNNKKQNKNKAFNTSFKYVLFGITLFVVFLIFAAFTVLIGDGLIEGSTSEFSNWTEILFGSEFSKTGPFAMGIIVVNTVWMSILVLLVATPISVSTALFITKIASKNVKNLMISVVSILAAIPSVVYGTFGKYVILVVVNKLGLSQLTTTASLIGTVVVVSLMVIPTITLMSITSITLVDSKMEDSSESLGATKVQTSLFVTLRSAKTGIIIGVLFALGRCLGEATAISMLAPQVSIQQGITFNLSSTTLFMSPAIMNAFNLAQDAPNSAGPFIYSVMSAMLLITIITLFAFIKFIEAKTDDQLRSKKQSKKAVEISTINNKVEKGLYDELSTSDIKLYERNLSISNDQLLKSQNQAVVREREHYDILNRLTLGRESKNAAFKKSRSLIYTAIIVAFSMIGVLALASIVTYLLSGDLSLLFKWDYLSSTGTVNSEWANGQYMGLGMSMFGTMFNIVAVLIIAIPLGVLIATFVTVYLRGDGFISRFVSFAFQIMTSIPAVIYGTLASIIFVSGGFFRQNLFSLVPIFMMVLVCLPTIIKQTQEGFRNINPSQMDGSFALGATHSYTSIRIVIKQAMPAILAAAILTISIIMAESAILITIIGQPDEWTYSQDWIKNGGYTLSTNIYYLSNASALDIPAYIAIDQMKAIGLILMLLIFWLSMISQKLKSKNLTSATIMFIGLIMYMTSFWLCGGILFIYILGLIVGAIGFAYDPIKTLRGKYGK